MLTRQKNTVKLLTTVNGEVTFDPAAGTGGDGLGAFVIASGTASRLNDARNYPNGKQALGTNTGCSGSSKLCKATYTYDYSDIDPNPTLQQIIDAINSHYVPATEVPMHVDGHFSSNPFTFVVSGITITVTIVEKS